jgi:hypothetical protein
VKKLSLYFVSLWFLAACGGNPVGIQFDASVPGNQKALIEGDLRLLSSTRLSAASQEDLTILNLGDLSEASLIGYLRERVQYVVGESFSLKGQVQTSQMASAPAPVIFSSIVDPTALSETQTVMWNLGSFLYLQAKDKKEVITLRLGLLNLWIRTPRVAIVQIGEGLFSANAITGIPLDARSNRFLRLGTLTHEGTHTNGNGANAAFPHVECPSGAYKGKAACDSKLNGPYAVQATLLKYLYAACQAQGCSEKELTGLTLSIADYRSRVLPGATLADPRPEQLP